MSSPPTTTQFTSRFAQPGEQVLEAVREGYRLIPVSTGHAVSMISAAGEGGHLVRVALDESVRVDCGAATITIPAGATWG